MKTLFGPEAKDGDYVLVTNVIGPPTTYPAMVHGNKAYTGLAYGAAGQKYLNRKEAVIVIPETYVSEEEKARIDKNIQSEISKDATPYIRPIKFTPKSGLYVCPDSRHECVSVYFEQNDALMQLFRKKVSEYLNKDEINCLSGVEFYGMYDPQHGNAVLSVKAQLCVDFLDYNITLDEKNLGRMVAAMERLCERQNQGRSCLEVVNSFRLVNDMRTVAEMDDLVEKLEKATAIEYKGIVFNAWEYNPFTNEVHAKVCTNCYQDNIDKLADELFDAEEGEEFMGVCSVRECCNGSTDMNEHYYVDLASRYITIMED